MDIDFRVAKLARWLSFLAGLIIVLLPFHEFLAVWLGSNIGHLDLIRIWKEILLAVMAAPVGWLAWRAPSLRTWILKSWIFRLYAVYILLHLTVGWWSLSTHQVNRVSLIYALLINLRFIGFFFICLVLAAYNSWLKNNWIRLVVWPSGIVIVFALLQRLVLPYDFLKHFGYGPSTIPAYQTVDANLSYQRVQSTLRGANPLGAYLALIVSAVVINLKKNRNLKTLLLLAALLAMFYTYSRSAWVGLVLSLATLAYLAIKKLDRRLIYAVLAVVIVAGVGLFIFRNTQSVQDTLLHTSASSHKQSSNAARNSAIEQGVKDVYHQPLGRGPGTAGPASFRNSGHPARIAEDYYLQIGQEVGLEGLAVFLAINLLVAWQLWQRRADNLAKILLASLVGISFINLVSHAWADDTLSLLWWGLAGIACAPVILKSKNKHYGKNQPKSPLARPVR
ncbi:MAG TPA: O-antigen ligase family protein [Candidatus Saccharimonadales bacterium]|nr:O-antigen ligase family protein [Candidatus Saccharimonadales bacterium]